MPTFKDFLDMDKDVFINPNEFADWHTINGTDYPVVVDNDKLQERSKVEYEGVAVGDILYFINADELEKRPKPDEVQVFDGIPCTIFDVRESEGLLEVILKKNVG